MENNRIFLTGATGFVGKVVLEELLRQKDKLNISEICLIIRKGRGGLSASDRFNKEIGQSQCFSLLPADWSKSVTIIEGDLISFDLGIAPDIQEELYRRITHVINCAASIEFTLPLKDASQANIQTAVNVLNFAKKCGSLKKMVSVSTAYVSPFESNTTEIHEVPANLPYPARDIYNDIILGKITEQKILSMTGHPNTYTLTKCLAEHILIEEAKDFPLSIVRPSIVSACWNHPFRGWIDSSAAFAAFIIAIGTGSLGALLCREKTSLDIVPCDHVAKKIIDNAFKNAETNFVKPDIIYASVGGENLFNVKVCAREIGAYFTKNIIHRKPELHYVGPRTLSYKMHHFRHNILPLNLAILTARINQNNRKLNYYKRVKGSLFQLNDIFEHFTHNTYLFKSSHSFDDTTFLPDKYIASVCEGVHKFILKKRR
jgi:thioester reductase-like protein